ncbi:efflux RND transporter periplasmic adaptor subunit [Pseudovibrio sp. Alg231-02]|uniref:efflux RND transporter periplasmic adaptor subunit n=1 Tax=Pseudovibrio sp. Alg231-02 TaxID=1922223 RepID=UPI000D54BB4B|nr:efflux RND transporter periplasmic adaptor subunit [Pseudovibrio sp. Alg231-02]
MVVVRWFIALLAITGVIGGLGYVKFTQVSEAIAQAALIPEHTETTEAFSPKTVKYAPQIQVIGEVIAPEQVELRTEISGRIVQLGFQPGDPVAEDQLLVQMDVSEEIAQLAATEADEKLAAIKFERAKKLRSTGSGSQSTLDNAQALLETAKAQVAQIKSRIQKKTIRAPFAGKTNTSTLSLGQILGANELITQIVGQTDRVWVDFKLPQHHMELGAGAGVTVIGQKGKQITATIIHRDATISTTTRTRTHRAEVFAQHLGMAHGAFVELMVPVARDKDYLSLPVTAVQTDGYGQFVYILHPDEQEGAYRAERRDVSHLFYLGESVLVDQGLTSNELVATNGAFKLAPGVLVYLSSPSDTPQQISSATYQ